VFVSLFLGKLFKNLAKARKYSLLWEEWNPVRKTPEHILAFYEFGEPADTRVSAYWESAVNIYLRHAF